MSSLKVITAIGTRPELIRLSRVIACLDTHFNHLLVHTGQNFDYELNEVFFDDFGIRKPDFFLKCSVNSRGSAETISNIINSFDRILELESPDAILVLGDTNSCLSVIAAKRRKIPIFHMEAGNRCFDQRVPEETNRTIVDHISDINLTYSDIARQYLLREGLPPDQIIKIGSPMREVLEHYLPNIEASDIVSRLNLSRENYFLVSVHREENIEPEKSFLKLVSVLNGLAEFYGLPIVVSTHPRTRKRLEENNSFLHILVRLEKPFGFFDYVKLQCEARATLSDSGTISEESSILNFPAINLREAHERPEAMEEGAVMMVGLELDRIHQALAILKSQGRGSKRTFKLVKDYDAPNVSEKAVRIMQSYTDYVNRVVWKKY